MTGIRVRVSHDGVMGNHEIDTLTDAELDLLPVGYPASGWRFAKALAQWIRDRAEHGQEPPGQPEEETDEEEAEEEDDDEDDELEDDEDDAEDDFEDQAREPRRPHAQPNRVASAR
jgi:hypothetical protein